MDSNKVTYSEAMSTANLVETNPLSALVDMKRISAHEDTDIIQLATQIQQADEALKHAACGKLTLILGQIKMLQEQARQILEETDSNKSLHHAACNFRKVPGKIYHLYQKDSGQCYFSMLSPDEWGTSNKHKYMGSYRLEADSTWTPLSETDKKDRMIAWSENILQTAKSTNDKSFLAILHNEN